MSSRRWGSRTGMESKNLADLYELPTVDWSRVTRRLDRNFTQAPGPGGPDRHTCWLATIDADGRPHVTGVGAEWADGAFWFETGARTRKARNLARDPRCTLSVATDEFDLVVEGEARLVTDPATVAASVTRSATPSTTRSNSSVATARQQRGSRATLRPLRVPSPVSNQNAPSAHSAPTPVTCGLPSAFRVVSQHV